MEKVRARRPEHLLGRNLLRGREAVPQDVAEVEPTRRAHEDLEHVHLRGAGHGVTEEPTQLGPRELSSPEPTGPRVQSTGDTGTDPCVPSTRGRRLPTFPYSSPRGRPLREMLYSHCACEKHAGGEGGDQRCRGPKATSGGTPGHAASLPHAERPRLSIKQLHGKRQARLHGRQPSNEARPPV